MSLLTSLKEKYYQYATQIIMCSIFNKLQTLLRKRRTSGVINIGDSVMLYKLKKLEVVLSR